MRKHTAAIVLFECLLGISVARTVAGQPSPHPEFAVASIKPSTAQGDPVYGTGNGRGYGENVTLKMLIGLAWQVQQFQIIGGPGWADSDRFEVEGKAEDSRADYAQLRLMVQSLLADRFKLRLHRETRQSSVYALVVAKGGPKIKLSPDQTSPDVVGAPTSPQDGPNRGGILMGPGMLAANAVVLSQFAKVIAPELDRFVIDRTNLAGRFDLRLRWSPESPSDPERAVIPADPSEALSIFTAVQEQLGLKFEPAKGPVEFLVIDTAEKPSAN
jgi:uncharacterized protein (TIGR03435 family)